MVNHTDYPNDQTARPADSDNRFVDWDKEILRHGESLPHWEQDRRTYFVTFRLGDSLPAGKVAEWRRERDSWMQLHPQPWDDATEEAYHAQFSARLEEWLDAGAGSCLLRNEPLGRTVANALLFFDGKRYIMDSFVVMPNHVHALYKAESGFELKDILHSWKSYTAHEINKMTGRAGALWQDDYWDRLVRNQEHLDALRSYIAENPLKAGLKPGKYILWRSKGGAGVPPA